MHYNYDINVQNYLVAIVMYMQLFPIASVRVRKVVLFGK